jgi:hypothetical protein
MIGRDRRHSLLLLSFPRISSAWDWQSEVESASSFAMLSLLPPIFALIFDRFRSRRRLEIENLYLRHELNIVCGRLRGGSDCAQLIEH